MMMMMMMMMRPRLMKWEPMDLSWQFVVGSSSQAQEVAQESRDFLPPYSGNAI